MAISIVFAPQIAPQIEWSAVLDRAGRIVLPKALRKRLGLTAGDVLKMETFGEQIVLQPVREKERLVKEHGFWVMYTGEPITAEQTNLILDQQRLDREADFVGISE